MASGKQRTEILVGLFILLGILTLGGLLFQFGKRTRPGGETYPLTVKVRDASGIRVGAPVRIGGFDIGKVESEPELDEDFKMLSIGILVRKDVKIPRGSEVNIGTSGLMGDRFIRILPPEKVSDDYYGAGEKVAASSAATIDDVATEAVQTLGQAEKTLLEIGESVKQLNDIFRRFDEGVLDERNVDNLKVTLENLRSASGRIETASSRIDPLLEEAGAAVTAVKETAEEAGTTLAGVNTGVEDFSRTLDSFDPLIQKFDGSLNELRATLRSVNGLMSEVQDGDGLADAMLNDAELREDLTRLIDKLEKNGFLFYPRERGLFRRADEEGEKPVSRPAVKP